MKGYRTYVAAALVALFGVLAQTNWVEFLANPQAGAVALGSAALMAIMRSITNSPPGQNYAHPLATIGGAALALALMLGLGGCTGGAATGVALNLAEIVIEDMAVPQLCAIVEAKLETTNTRAAQASGAVVKALCDSHAGEQAIREAFKAFRKKAA